MAMSKIADALADGVRVNERMEKRSEKQPADGLSAPIYLHPGIFSKRMDKRYQTELRYRHDRLQRASMTLDNSDLSGVAELEGDCVHPAIEDDQARKEYCLRTANHMMHPDTYEAGPFDAGGAVSSTDGPLPNVTVQTRMHLTSSATPRQAERAMRKAKRSLSGPLPDTTAETRMLMVGLVSNRELGQGRKQEVMRAASSSSKFREMGLSPSNRRIDDHHGYDDRYDAVTRGKTVSPLKLRSMNLRKPPIALSIPRKMSPKKSFLMPPGAKDVNVEGVQFDMLPTPVSRSSAAPLIPPRRASKQYNLSLRENSPFTVKFAQEPFAYMEGQRVKLVTLTPELRKKIIGDLVICREHEVFVCSCGICAWSASKQPAIARVNRKLRTEVLPVFYGENRFTIRGVYDWDKKAPAWLRALSQPSRNMIKHVKISTADITSAVCMMATMGFRLSHRLPGKDHIAVMSEMRDATIWMTFTAISPDPVASKDMELAPGRPSISLWNDGEVKQLMLTEELVDEDLDSATVIDGARVDDTDTQSITTIGTGILDPARNSMDSGIVGHGRMAQMARGRVVTVPQCTRTSKHAESGGAEIDSIAGMIFNRRSIGQRLAVPRQRYSVAHDILSRASMEKS